MKAIIATVYKIHDMTKETGLQLVECDVKQECHVYALHFADAFPIHLDQQVVLMDFEGCTANSLLPIDSLDPGDYHTGDDVTKMIHDAVSASIQSSEVHDV